MNANLASTSAQPLRVEWTHTTAIAVKNATPNHNSDHDMDAAKFAANCKAEGGVQISTARAAYLRGPHGVLNSTPVGFRFPDGSVLIGCVRDGYLRGQRALVPTDPCAND